MKKLAKKVLSLAALGGIVLPVIACGPNYERIELTGEKKSPLGGEVKANHVSVPEGMIVKAHVVPYNDDGEPMQQHVFPRDPDVLEVIAVVNDRDYAFIGKKPGRTQVEFQADGETVLIVEAVVTEQPPPESLPSDPDAKQDATKDTTQQ